MEEKFCFQGNKSHCTAPFVLDGQRLQAVRRHLARPPFRLSGGRILAQLPEGCEVTLFSGTPEGIISEYISLFGPPVLPPGWVFGPWISANRWSCQADVEAAVAEAEALGFPVSVLVLEAWSDEATFLHLARRQVCAEAGRRAALAVGL
ncbi:MAG: hypothetical protein ACLTSG_04235 [Lachnospiraceae bacterium]